MALTNETPNNGTTTCVEIAAAFNTGNEHANSILFGKVARHDQGPPRSIVTVQARRRLTEAAAAGPRRTLSEAATFARMGGRNPRPAHYPLI